MRTRPGRPDQRRSRDPASRDVGRPDRRPGRSGPRLQRRSRPAASAPGPPTAGRGDTLRAPTTGDDPEPETHRPIVGVGCWSVSPPRSPRSSPLRSCPSTPAGGPKRRPSMPPSPRRQQPLCRGSGRAELRWHESWDDLEIGGTDRYEFSGDDVSVKFRPEDWTGPDFENREVDGERNLTETSSPENSYLWVPPISKSQLSCQRSRRPEPRGRRRLGDSSIEGRRFGLHPGDMDGQDRSGDDRGDRARSSRRRRSVVSGSGSSPVVGPRSVLHGQPLAGPCRRSRAAPALQPRTRAAWAPVGRPTSRDAGSLDRRWSGRPGRDATRSRSSGWVSGSGTGAGGGRRPTKGVAPPVPRRWLKPDVAAWPSATGEDRRRGRRPAAARRRGTSRRRCRPPRPRPRPGGTRPPPG